MSEQELPFKRVSIVGDGSMATVCALMLESRGAEVTVWGYDPAYIETLIQTRENVRYLPGYKLPDAIRFTADGARLFRDTELIVSATPTQFMRSVWTTLASDRPAGAPIVSVAKGIEADTYLRPSQIIADVIEEAETSGASGGGVPSLAALSGPSVAHELARCLPATVCAASDDLAFAEQLQAMFRMHWFRVYTNPDLLGVELAGATKNVIALAAGILDGLQAGNNAKSALLSRGLVEITRLGVAMGAERDTFFGIAGVGDLATTCFSPTGRNRTCGEQLGRGRKLDEVLADIPGIVEGVPTTKAVVKIAEQFAVDMPITQSVHDVLFEGLDPIEAIGRLMSREPKADGIG